MLALLVHLFSLEISEVCFLENHDVDVFLCCHVQDVASFVKASDVTLPDPKAVCVVKLLLAFAVEVCRMCRMYVSSARSRMRLDSFLG